MTEKEIWMVKLMWYVEEMQKEWINICRPQFQQYYLVEMMLVSKYYWLVKWLVDNDKIDFEEYADEWRDSNINNNADFFQLYKHYDMYECVLMILAISDEPIEFLISILK